MSQPLVKDCQFGVSPVNYSDSDSDECELKKRLNFCKQYKLFTGLCDFIPKCRSWRIVDAVKDKQKKKIQIKTTKAKKYK